MLWQLRWNTSNTYGFFFVSACVNRTLYLYYSQNWNTKLFIFIIGYKNAYWSEISNCTSTVKILALNETHYYFNSDGLKGVNMSVCGRPVHNLHSTVHAGMLCGVMEKGMDEWICNFF